MGVGVCMYVMSGSGDMRLSIWCVMWCIVQSVYLCMYGGCHVSVCVVYNMCVSTQDEGYMFVTCAVCICI